MGDVAESVTKTSHGIPIDTKMLVQDTRAALWDSDNILPQKTKELLRRLLHGVLLLSGEADIGLTDGEIEEFQQENKVYNL